MLKFRKTLRVALLVGFIISLMLWLVILVNGELAPSGEPGFLANLLHLQQPGSDVAHRWFPCGNGPAVPAPSCTYLRIVPTTILVNALIYAGLLFIPIFIFRLFSTSLD
jgi:hypothetical protein